MFSYQQRQHRQNYPERSLFCRLRIFYRKLCPGPGHDRRSYEDANLVAMDCDAGASEVNQLDRLKLMLSVAKEKCPEGMHMAEAAETAENSLA